MTPSNREDIIKWCNENGVIPRTRGERRVACEVFNLLTCNQKLNAAAKDKIVSDTLSDLEGLLNGIVLHSNDGK